MNELIQHDQVRSARRWLLTEGEKFTKYYGEQSDCLEYYKEEDKKKRDKEIQKRRNNFEKVFTSYDMFGQFIKREGIEIDILRPWRDSILKCWKNGYPILEDFKRNNHIVNRWEDFRWLSQMAIVDFFESEFYEESILCRLFHRKKMKGLLEQNPPIENYYEIVTEEKKLDETLKLKEKQVFKELALFDTLGLIFSLEESLFSSDETKDNNVKSIRENMDKIKTKWGFTIITRYEHYKKYIEYIREPNKNYLYKAFEELATQWKGEEGNNRK